MPRRLITGHQVGVVRAGVDLAQRRLELGQAVGEEDDAEEDADNRHAAAKQDRVNERRRSRCGGLRCTRGDVSTGT